MWSHRTNNTLVVIDILVKDLICIRVYTYIIHIEYILLPVACF